MDAYPPEFDGPDVCAVCCAHVDACDCPECPECASVGGPECYAAHGLPFAPDSVGAFVAALGCGATLSENFRAIDRHSSPPCHAILHTHDGRRFDDSTPRADLDALPHWLRLRAIGCAAIPWDGTDAEFYAEASTAAEWETLSGETLSDWLADHEASRCEWDHD